MGDLSDMADLDRWLRCDAGKKRLEEIRAFFMGRTVVDVEFGNEVQHVGVTITFTTGDKAGVEMSELTLDHLKEEFRVEMLEEYYRDYPDRRPTTEKEEG